MDDILQLSAHTVPLSAPALSQTDSSVLFQSIQKDLQSGQSHSVHALQSIVAGAITDNGGRIDYVEVRSLEDTLHNNYKTI